MEVYSYFTGTCRFYTLYQVEVVAQVKVRKKRTSAVTYKFSTTSAQQIKTASKKKTIDIENEKNKNMIHILIY
jgi:hypothetical protein